MAKQKQSNGKQAKAAFVLGHTSFAKVSEVEDIRLKPTMKKRAVEAAECHLSAAQRRAKIIRAHRKV